MGNMGKIWVICIHIQLTHFGPSLPAAWALAGLWCFSQTRLLVPGTHTSVPWLLPSLPGMLSPLFSISSILSYPISLPICLKSNNTSSTKLSLISTASTFLAFLICVLSWYMWLFICIFYPPSLPPEEIKPLVSREHIFSLIPYSIPNYKWPFYLLLLIIPLQTLDL